MTTIQTTTTRLRLPLRDRARAWLAQRDPLILIAAAVLPLVALLLIGAVWRAQRPAQTATVQPTLAPIMIIATARAVELPTAVPVQPRLITAYDQPNGSAFPEPIPMPDPATWIGRWGDGWIQVQWQPNPVWIRTEDLGANLADVRPAVPSVQIAPVVAAPALTLEAEQYQVANESPAVEAAPPAADERQTNIQAHYANEHIDAAPAPAAVPATAATPSLQDALDATNADVQAAPNGGDRWREEHCVADVCH